MIHLTAIYHFFAYFIKKIILCLLRNFDKPFELFEFNKKSTIISATYKDSVITNKLRIIQYMYYRDDYIGLDLLKYVHPRNYGTRLFYHIKTKNFNIVIAEYDDITYIKGSEFIMINDSKRIELINFPEPIKPIEDLRTTEMIKVLEDL